MLGAGVAGSLIGVQAGVLFWLLQRLSGETIEERWAREYAHRPVLCNRNRNFLPCGTGTVTCQKVGTGTVINYGYVTVLKWYHKSSHKHTVQNCVFPVRHLIFFHSHFTINLMKPINFFLVKKFRM
jgi:hypothetical protein